MVYFEKGNLLKGVFSQPTNQSLSQDKVYNVELQITEVDTNKHTFSGEMTWNQIGNKQKLKENILTIMSIWLSMN